MLKKMTTLQLLNELERLARTEYGMYVFEKVSNDRKKEEVKNEILSRTV